MPLHLILYSKIFKDYIMKRIIMFKGGVETLEFFSVEIAEYLESKGYEIFWYNLLLSKNSFNELMHYYNNHCNEQLYAITFNFEGLEGEEGLYNNDGWNFWDYSGVTVSGTSPVPGGQSMNIQSVSSHATSSQNCLTALAITGPLHITGSVSLSRR